MTSPSRQTTRWLAPPNQEMMMKIKIVKTGSFNAKPSGYCPFMVDEDTLSSAKK